MERTDTEVRSGRGRREGSSRSRSRSRDHKRKDHKRAKSHKHRSHNKSHHKKHHRRRSRSRSESRSSSGSSSRSRSRDVRRAREDPKEATKSSWSPDLEKAQNVIAMMLSARPEVYADLCTLAGMLDTGEGVDLSGLEDPFTKTGLNALFVALGLENQGTTYFAPRGAEIEQWMKEHVHPPLPAKHPAPARIIGPMRPDAGTGPYQTAEASNLPVMEDPDEESEDDAVGPRLPGDPRGRAPAPETEAAPEPPAAGSTRAWMEAMAEGVLGKKTLPRRLQMAAPTADSEPPAKAAEKSLVELTQAAIPKPAPVETQKKAIFTYRPFDREKDLQMRKPVDVNRAIQGAGHLNSRFEASGTYSPYK